jgi:hypothetical protein
MSSSATKSISVTGWLVKVSPASLTERLRKFGKARPASNSTLSPQNNILLAQALGVVVNSSITVG